jgi:hypothetical protein
MNNPKYTKDDMRKYAEMSEEDSVPAQYLEELDYDPKRYREFLKEHKQAKEIKYLFETPLIEIPILINRGELVGCLQFRLSIGK